MSTGNGVFGFAKRGFTKLICQSNDEGGKPMKSVHSLTTLLIALAVNFAAPGHAATVDEVALYNKPDRQKILVDGARKEGKITWYTSLIVDQVVRPVKEAFEKEYPFLQVEYFRGNSERLVQKMFAEYQGKRYEVDIVDGTVRSEEHTSELQSPCNLVCRL